MRSPQNSDGKALRVAPYFIAALFIVGTDFWDAQVRDFSGAGKCPPKLTLCQTGRLY